MAYATANLMNHTGGLAGDGMGIWNYDDTATVATIVAAGYISDAYDRKMRVGDIVYYRRFADLADRATITSVHLCRVTAVVDGTGATLSAGLAIT